MSDCDKCQKAKTVHLTEIINGQVSEVHLCSDCPKLNNLHLTPSFNLTQTLAHFAQESMNPQKAPDDCPTCDMSYEQFLNGGRLGCAQDYEIFKAQLEPYFDKIHGSRFHCGKAPGHSADADDSIRRMSELRRQLRHAIDSENYEEAARLRDQLKNLETK